MLHFIQINTGDDRQLMAQPLLAEYSDASLQTNPLLKSGPSTPAANEEITGNPEIPPPVVADIDNRCAKNLRVAFLELSLKELKLTESSFPASSQANQNLAAYENQPRIVRSFSEMSDKMLAASYGRTDQRQHLRRVV